MKTASRIIILMAVAIGLHAQVNPTRSMEMDLGPGNSNAVLYLPAAGPGQQVHLLDVSVSVTAANSGSTPQPIAVVVQSGGIPAIGSRIIYHDSALVQNPVPLHAYTDLDLSGPKGIWVPGYLMAANVSTSLADWSVIVVVTYEVVAQ